MFPSPRAALLAAAVLAPSFVGSVVAAQGALAAPASARALGMGGVAIAGRDDDVLFYNPAQLVVARGMSASAERFSPGSRGGTLSSVARFGNGGIAVGASLVDFRNSVAIPDFVRDPLAANAGQGTSVVAALGIGQTFKGFRVGAAAKYAERHLDARRRGEGVVDLGVSHDLLRRYTVGLAVQNLPTRSGSTPAERASRAALGLAGAFSPVGPFDVTLTAQASSDVVGAVRPAGGAEATWSWLEGYAVALRAGARRPAPGEGVLTAGAGFSMDRLTIDYALETLAGARVAHRVGLRIR